jgi:hypothetical protein
MNKWLKGYRYLFYRLYKWQLVHFHKVAMPKLNAFLIVSIISFFNLATLLLVFQYFSATPVFQLVAERKPLVLLVAVLNLAVNYFLFGKKGRVRGIMREFGTETRRNRRHRELYLLAYFFVLIFVFVFLLMSGSYDQ